MPLLHPIPLMLQSCPKYQSPHATRGFIPAKAFEDFSLLYRSISGVTPNFHPSIAPLHVVLVVEMEDANADTDRHDTITTTKTGSHSRPSNKVMDSSPTTDETLGRDIVQQRSVGQIDKPKVRGTRMSQTRLWSRRQHTKNAPPTRRGNGVDFGPSVSMSGHPRTKTRCSPHRSAGAAHHLAALNRRSIESAALVPRDTHTF